MSSELDGGKPVVAHVTRTSLQPTETFIYHQLAGLRRYRPLVVCHHRGQGLFPIEPDLVAGETRVGPARLADAVGDGLLRIPLPGTVRTMARFAERQNAAVLHFHYLPNARSYLPLERLTQIPAVVSAYGYDASAFPRRAAGLGRRFLAPIFSRIELFLAMSDRMRRDLIEIGCPEERILVHYHGVETRRFAFPLRDYATRDPLTILIVGRLVPTKGHLELVSALARVRSSCDIPFRLVVVGNGPLHRRLEREIDRLRMNDVTELVGSVLYTSSEHVAHFRRADVFALPCATDGGQREGIPTALVEAMAAGLPIVSTRHGGIPEVVEDGRDGLLVDEKDPQQLAQALERVLTDAALRRALGTAAAERAAQELDIVPASAGLERIYDQLRDRGS